MMKTDENDVQNRHSIRRFVDLIDSQIGLSKGKLYDVNFAGFSAY